MAQCREKTFQALKDAKKILQTTESTKYLLLLNKKYLGVVTVLEQTS